MMQLLNDPDFVAKFTVVHQNSGLDGPGYRQHMHVLQDELSNFFCRLITPDRMLAVVPELQTFLKPKEQYGMKKGKTKANAYKVKCHYCAQNHFFEDCANNHKNGPGWNTIRFESLLETNTYLQNNHINLSPGQESESFQTDYSHIVYIPSLTFATKKVKKVKVVATYEYNLTFKQQGNANQHSVTVRSDMTLRQTKQAIVAKVNELGGQLTTKEFYLRDCENTRITYTDGNNMATLHALGSPTFVEIRLRMHGGGSDAEQDIEDDGPAPAPAPAPAPPPGDHGCNVVMVIDNGDATFPIEVPFKRSDGNPQERLITGAGKLVTKAFEDLIANRDAASVARVRMLLSFRNEPNSEFFCTFCHNIVYGVSTDLIPETDDSYFENLNRAYVFGYCVLGFLRTTVTDGGSIDM